MRWRRTLAWVALLAALVIPAVEGRELSSTASAAESDSKRIEREVILYYFHGTRRCNTCRNIEAYAQRAVEMKFKDDINAGALQWKVLNTDEAANAHFLKDFGLVSSSLVVVEMNGDQVVRHDVLQDAWTLVRDEPRFILYIQRSVHEYLK